MTEREISVAGRVWIEDEAKLTTAELVRCRCGARVSVLEAEGHAMHCAPLRAHVVHLAERYGVRLHERTAL